MKNTLINSCNQLKRDGILSVADIEKCRKIDSSYGGLNKKLGKKIFNENREDRLTKLDNIHEFIGKVIESEFDVLKKDIKDIGETQKFRDVIKDSKYNNFGNLYALMRMIMIETDKKILKRYENNENINYDVILNNYSKIDSNRKKMEDIGGSYDTLMEVNESEYEKLNKSSYTGCLIGVIVLFMIIAGLIVYIIKFMKI